jgi:hypothetical protein
MKTNDVLDRFAFILRSHLRSQRVSGSQMARSLEITPPTLFRMLSPHQQGSGGVCLRTWCRALEKAGYLEPLVSGLEKHLRSRDHRFVPLTPDAGTAPDDSALLRIGYVLRQAIQTSRVPSSRQLAFKIGVTPPTIATLLGAPGPHAGGTAIKHLIRTITVLGLGSVFAKTLPEPRRLYEPPTDGEGGPQSGPS